MKTNNTTPGDYAAIFKYSTAGAKILEQLTGIFYDRPSYVQDNQYNTAYNEGQRSVLQYIIGKIMEAENNSVNKAVDVNDVFDFDDNPEDI